MASIYDNYEYHDYSGVNHAIEGQCWRCGRRVNYYCAGERIYCAGCAGYRPTPTPTIDTQVAQAEKRVAELLAKKEAMAKFGSDDEYGEDDAILFKRQFKRAGKAYTYVAVKSGIGWFITGQDASRAITFETLVEEHLMKANEVWVCTEWRQIC